MSARMSQIVWSQAPYKADRLLVLLAMAEWANDDGICCVSYDKLADKARTTKRRAVAITQTLIADDAIRLVQKGGGRGKPSVYQLLPQNWHRERKKKIPSTRLLANPTCLSCEGLSTKSGITADGTQAYRCKACSWRFTLTQQGKPHNKHSTDNPRCRDCDRDCIRYGISPSGKQQYRCEHCQRQFSLSLRQQRQHKVQLQQEHLLPLIAGKVPKELPPEVREEMIQELAVAVLAGEFELSQLDEMVTRFRRKVYRESLTGFAYVSLDAGIPNAEGLTLADTLAG
jgi:transposase-like protein